MRLIKKVFQAQQKLAEASGFTVKELMGGKHITGPAAGSKAAIRYRNPDDPSKTWSGRGRMATWLKNKISKRGVKFEDFLV